MRTANFKYLGIILTLLFTFPELGHARGIFSFKKTKQVAPKPQFITKIWWKKNSPKQAARYLTQTTLDHFPHSDYSSCNAKLAYGTKKDTKDFVQKYDTRAVPLNNETNSVYSFLTQEGERVKNKHSRKTLKRYLEWLFRTSIELFEMNNFHFSSQFIYAILHLSDYDHISKTFGFLPVKRGEIFKLTDMISHLTTPAGSLRFEELVRANHASFIPSLSNIRIQLEKMSGENFEMDFDTQVALANSVCHRLSTLNLRSYEEEQNFFSYFNRSRTNSDMSIGSSSSSDMSVGSSSNSDANVNSSSHSNGSSDDDMDASLLTDIAEIEALVHPEAQSDSEATPRTMDSSDANTIRHLERNSLVDATSDINSASETRTETESARSLESDIESTSSSNSSPRKGTPAAISVSETFLDWEF